jgi:hypothetical protein
LLHAGRDLRLTGGSTALSVPKENPVRRSPIQRRLDLGLVLEGLTVQRSLSSVLVAGRIRSFQMHTSSQMPYESSLSPASYSNLDCRSGRRELVTGTRQPESRMSWQTAALKIIIDLDLWFCIESNRPNQGIVGWKRESH